MACLRCGCHLLSRASGERGGLRGVLVCTGCNQPIEPRLHSGGWQKKIAEAGTLLALLFAGGVLFTLSTLQDMQAPRLEPERAAAKSEG